MSSNIRKLHHHDCISVPSALTNNKTKKNTLNAAVKMLCEAVSSHITKIALDRGLYFRPSKPLALISGAGIAGLAASFELRAKGFNVVIVEKRECFCRFNVINLNIETQIFLKRFNLLEKFEKHVAARIKEHRYVLIDKSKSIKRLALSDVSELQLDDSVSLDPENFHKLFEQDGIYSVPIAVLQTFLAENALGRGVNILGNITARVLSRRQNGGVSKVQITYDKVIRPDLFFIAEGAHSQTACALGMETTEISNSCTGENWIFGNMTYSGKETFVVSLIDTSDKTLRIANVIFNAQSKVINIAVTSEKTVTKDKIKKQILQTLDQVFTQTVFPMERIHSELLTTVPKPVHIVNRTAEPFSLGNTFCIGDSAGSSSPLAGLGGTLGLTLIPRTVKQLLDDHEDHSPNIHQNFHTFSKGYTSRWIEKSEGIKKFCISLFDKEHNAS